MSACVLDTGIVIAALDRADAHHAAAAASISAMIAADTQMLLSLVNYAETLVRPAQDEATLRAALAAVSALGIRLVAPTETITRNAARHRGLNISLADGFAIATAQVHGASLASFDVRVRRALRTVGVELATELAQ